MVTITRNPPPEPAPPETFIGHVRALMVGQAIEAEMKIEQARTVVSRVKAGFKNTASEGRQFNTYPANGKVYIKRVA